MVQFLLCLETQLFLSHHPPPSPGFVPPIYLLYQYHPCCLHRKVAPRRPRQMLLSRLSDGFALSCDSLAVAARAAGKQTDPYLRAWQATSTGLVPWIHVYLCIQLARSRPYSALDSDDDEVPRERTKICAGRRATPHKPPKSTLLERVFDLYHAAALEKP